ncbi:Queuosine salvage protein [Balamuthia mandrillaris]
MHISGDKLDSTFLQKMDVGQVANLFDLKLQEEKELKEAVFFVSSPTALVPLAETIQRVMNETGTILLAKGFKEGLGQWVLDFVRQTEGCTAAQLVESLANTFPAFRDVATYNGQDVYILKKAQLLAADLFRQLGEKEPAFLFADVTELTIFSDNVIPAVLREYGVLELSEELAAHVDHKTVLKPGDREVELRCVAIHACEEIVKLWKAKSGAEGGQPIQLNAMLLDYFLWEMGKQGHFRKVERHYTTDTAFY